MNKSLDLDTPSVRPSYFRNKAVWAVFTCPECGKEVKAKMFFHRDSEGDWSSCMSRRCIHCKAMHVFNATLPEDELIYTIRNDEVITDEDYLQVH